MTHYSLVIVLTVLLQMKSSFAQDETGTILATIENRNGDTIPPIAVELYRDSIVFRKDSTHNGAIKLNSVPVGKYGLKIFFENGQSYSVTGIQVASNDTTQIHHTLTYPCYFYEQKTCPVKHGGKHKGLPVEQAIYYGTESEYFKQEKGKILYYNSTFEDDCFPDRYCKKHKTFY